MAGLFTMSEIRPLRDGMTISRDSKLGKETKVTFFSLGNQTSISQEAYDEKVLYLGGVGQGRILLGKEKKICSLFPGSLLIVSQGTLCGMDTDKGVIYTEVILKGKVNHMNQNVKTNEVFELKNLIDYEEGSIANMDVVSTGNMKYVLMAFDQGTGLTPHRAPGNAIVFALEGKAIIGYEGKDYELSEGQCFRFEKNGLHSVTANGRFKMALLLVVE